ncbi:MAG: hypothetical protein ACK4Z6_03395 [Candidatus Methylomirabilales bacterium]
MIRLFTPEEAAYLRWSAKVNRLIQGIILAETILFPLLLSLSGRQLPPYLLLFLITVLILGNGLALALFRRRREKMLEDLQGGRVAILSGPLEAKRGRRIRIRGQVFPVAHAWIWQKLKPGETVTVEYAPNSKIVLRINDHRQF